MLIDTVFTLIPVLSLFTIGKAQFCLSPDLVNSELSRGSKTGNYKTGDVIHYQCKTGYHFKGSNSTSRKTRCNEEIHWEPKPQPCYDSCGNQCARNGYCQKSVCLCDNKHVGTYCEQRICKMPLIEHSHRVERLYSPTTTNVKVKDNWVIMGTRISIVCDQDYTLNLDSALFTCRQNGWDFGTSPICKPNFCNHQPFNHGVVTPFKELYKFRDNVKFSCSKGYELEGSATLSCRGRGTWSDTWPTCREKRCQGFHLAHGLIDPPDLRNSAGTYPIKAPLQLSCFSGYFYKGISQKILCKEEDASWSSEPGSCLSGREYSQYCGKQGKVFKVFSGKAYCVLKINTPPTDPPQQSSSSLKKTEKPLTIVTSTAGGLLLLLLLVIAIVACQRRRIARLRRERAGGRHRLNSDDDRLAFVYYSNDVHVVLPSYDEAMQNRRVNNPPPYMPDEVVAAAAAIAQPTNALNSGSNTPPNLYETIDEIRTTVNAVRASLSTTTSNNNENGDSDGQVNNSRSGSSLEATSGLDVATGTSTVAAANDTDIQPSRFEIYDGPTEEPIYASVKRVLSRSLWLANRKDKKEEEVEEREENVADATKNIGDRDSVDELHDNGVGFDNSGIDEDEDFEDVDTAPLL